MKSLFLVLLFAGTIGTATAADVNVFSLDNGMEVLVLEDHRAPVVVHMVWYRVGAADEQPGKSGIAHFLEHLMFKGTDEMEAGELSAVVNQNGGTDNAFTSWDYTAYYQRVAADRLDLMMKMEADRMRDLQMTEGDVATERQVVLEERSQRIDSQPGSLFQEQRRAAQYLNHPYGIPIIGWRHEIVQLNREDAFAFYRRYYAPNNAILIVSGDVDPQEVLALARQHYGPLKPSLDIPERFRPQEPPQLSERRMTFSDPRVSQPYVTRSYLAPERDSGNQEAAARLTMLAAVLGGNAATSVLGRKLQFESQKSVYVTAFYDGISMDDSEFGLVTVPPPDLTLEQAEAALDQAIAEFLVEGIDPDQFARIKMQIRAEQIYGEDDIGSRAQEYGMALTSGLTVADVDAWPDVLQAVTEDDVMQAARDIFDQKKAVTGWIMPLQTQEESQ
ncbi:MAG: insulinase family protein [Paracoccaceae bacterium]|nr:insulinase family protein [Paracoccaceae bacterium]